MESPYCQSSRKIQKGRAIYANIVTTNYLVKILQQFDQFWRRRLIYFCRNIHFCCCHFSVWRAFLHLSIKYHLLLLLCRLNGQSQQLDGPIGGVLECGYTKQSLWCEYNDVIYIGTIHKNVSLTVFYPPNRNTVIIGIVQNRQVGSFLASKTSQNSATQKSCQQ